MNNAGRISSSGFTLLELIIVMIIVGLMSVLVVPVIGSSLSSMELKTAAKKTASALRYCRSKAAMQKTVYVAGIDFATNIISVESKKEFPEKPEGADDPDIKIDYIKNYLPLIDNIIIMSVYPGFGKQKFISASLEKIKKIKKIITANNLNISISVDGAIDENTSKKVIECGADILIYGSSIFKDKKYS